MQAKPELTIFTDGSRSEETSSWGFLFKDEKKPLMFVGLCPKFFKNICSAEALSILKALEFIQSSNKTHLSVIIYTDSLMFTHILNKKIKNSSKGCQLTLALKRQIKAIAKQLKHNRGIDVKIQYVKAHTQKTDSTSLGNRTVDFYVRRLMKKHRRFILRKEVTLTEKISKFFYTNLFQQMEESYWVDAGAWKALSGVRIPPKKVLQQKNTIIQWTAENQKHLKAA